MNCKLWTDVYPLRIAPFLMILYSFWSSWWDLSFETHIEFSSFFSSVRPSGANFCWRAAVRRWFVFPEVSCFSMFENSPQRCWQQNSTFFVWFLDSPYPTDSRKFQEFDPRPYPTNLQIGGIRGRPVSHQKPYPTLIGRPGKKMLYIDPLLIRRWRIWHL